jgi:RNA polymerase sigma-70 factor (ECF subfamily)
MLPVESHRELRVQEPVRGGGDGREAPDAALSDCALVILLHEQPVAGVAALYDRYGWLVFSMALRIAQDHSAAEEITQDVFLRCWQSIDRYHPQQGSLAAWLLRITRHRAIDELCSRRGKELRRKLFDDAIDPLAASATGYDAALLRSEVQRALHLLPPAQRDVIELIFWAGLTRREIAEQLQLPLGAIHTRLRLGMEQLRAALGRPSAEE